MGERPLSPKMLDLLRVMREAYVAWCAGESMDYPMTPNSIAYAMGYRPGDAKSANHGRGNTTRVMGPAVHVNTALTALRKRGLVTFGARPDGLSGTAYSLTEAGFRETEKP